MGIGGGSDGAGVGGTVGAANAVGAVGLQHCLFISWISSENPPKPDAAVVARTTGAPGPSIECVGGGEE